ncbi:MAG TPA: hypothetical protein VKI61_13470 [Chitinophagaceae bacterium]|nr:hypothetical protein [Chitinophagaceae bacterium]
MAKPLKKTLKDGKVIYKDLENRGQYFRVEDNGNLSVYDKDGYVWQRIILRL